MARAADRKTADRSRRDAARDTARSTPPPIAPPAPDPRTRIILVGCAVVALAAGAYANALSNGLVWDDPIVRERQLRVFRSLGDIFFPPKNIPQFSPDYYRPLTILSYFVDRAFGGDSTVVFHGGAVLYHLIATAMVYSLGLVLFRGSPLRLTAAGCGAALFAVHPIHTESVAWGAGRSDVIASCFAVAAAAVYISTWSTRRWRSSVAIGLLFLGMLSKETATAVLLLLPLSDFILPAPQESPGSNARAERRRQVDLVPARRLDALFPYALLTGVLVVYLVLRQAALGLMVGEAEPLTANAVVSLIGALGFYISKLVLPLWQNAYVSDLPTQPLQLLAAVVAWCGLAAAAWISWRRGLRAVTFALLWLAVTLAPSLSIVLKIPTAPVAERYLYLPSVGFCLLAGYAVAALAARGLRVPIAILSVAILAAATVATVQRNTVWRSNMQLWSDATAKNTTDGMPLRSLAAAYLEQGDAAKAQELFLQALQRRNNKPGQYTIYNNLGSLAMQRKDLDAAERYYRTATSINAESEGFYNLGLVALTRALEAEPSRDATWKREQAEQARQFFQQAAQRSPHDPDIQVGLGQALTAVGDADGARAAFERALALGLRSSTEVSVRKLLADLK